MSAIEEINRLHRLAKRVQDWRDKLRSLRVTRAEILFAEKAVIAALEAWESGRE